MTTGVQAERTWRSRKAHPRFFRSTAPLAIVAKMAARDQIFPSRFTRARPRLHVIERQFSRIESSQAILARITIAHQNILPRKRPRLMRNAAILQQPDHTRHPHGLPCGMDMRVAVLLRRCDAFQYQHQRAPRRAYVDRLVAGIQYKYRFMEPLQHAFLRIRDHGVPLRSRVMRRSVRATAATAT